MQAIIRNALVSAINDKFVTAYPGIPIVYDNAPFDRNSPPPIWVEYEIKFAGARQVSLGFIPKTRVHGFLYVTVWARDGTGTKNSLTMLDWFSSQLGYIAFGGVNLRAAEPVGGKGPAGWHIEQIKLYFYSDPA